MSDPRIEEIRMRVRLILSQAVKVPFGRTGYYKLSIFGALEVSEEVYRDPWDGNSWDKTFAPIHVCLNHKSVISEGSSSFAALYTSDVTLIEETLSVLRKAMVLDDLANA